jgi:hypothetical protein
MGWGASCPQAPAGATLTATTNRTQTDLTLVIKGTGYTPNQQATVTIQHVPGRTADMVRTPTANASGEFMIDEPFSLRHVPSGSQLQDVSVIGRDAAGWFRTASVPASAFVIFD